MTPAAQPARAVLDAAADQAGLATEGAELIRDGANVLYRLPKRVVARIGRPGSRGTAQREVQVSRWLTEVGFSVVRALDDIEQPTMVDDRPVTWWGLLPEHRPATPAELGTILRQLHELPIPPELGLPALDPFAELAERVQAADWTTTDNHAWLTKHLHDLEKQYANLPAPERRCVVHGDAWQGNVAVFEQQAVLLDLDHVSVGRPEWDLISLAVDRTDFERITGQEYRAFIDAYGGFDVTTWPGYRTLADIQELRWAAFALAKAGSNPAAKAEADHRLSCLRGDVPRPWAWSAF